LSNRVPFITYAPCIHDPFVNLLNTGAAEGPIGERLTLASVTVVGTGDVDMAASEEVLLSWGKDVSTEMVVVEGGCVVVTSSEIVDSGAADVFSTMSVDNGGCVNVSG
jgi:hypothetical protein